MQQKMIAVYALVALAACASAYPGGHGAISHASIVYYGGHGGYSNDVDQNGEEGDGGYAQETYSHQPEHDAPAHYKFDYAVHDPHTHDIKNQWETRDGDVVKGSYSLLEADGTTRTVDYTADHHNGFNAVIRKNGHAHHPQVYAHDGHY